MIDSTARHRASLIALAAGLLSTVVAFVVPLIDVTTGDTLAAHVRAGYPEYSEAEISTVTTSWLWVIGIVAAISAVGWLIALAGTARHKHWPVYFGAAALVIGILLALTMMFIRDISDDTGLPLSLSAIQLLPCIAGAVAVALLAGRRTPNPTRMRSERFAVGGAGQL